LQLHEVQQNVGALNEANVGIVLLVVQEMVVFSDEESVVADYQAC